MEIRIPDLENRSSEKVIFDTDRIKEQNYIQGFWNYVKGSDVYNTVIS